MIMKKLILIISFYMGYLTCGAQGLKKYTIDNTGCALYGFCDFRFETEYSQDSSLVFVSECENGEVNYGVILIKLRNPVNDLQQVENSLIAYLDYLKTSFKIKRSVGYGKGHLLNNDEHTRGVLDFWEDADKNNWKVKGWANTKYMAVMYGYSAKELPATKLDVFLDSIRFPGM
jgi:hypothetical protein